MTTAPATAVRNHVGDRGTSFSGVPTKSSVTAAVWSDRILATDAASATANPIATGVKALWPLDKSAAHHDASTIDPTARPTPTVSPPGASRSRIRAERAAQIPNPRHAA